MAEIVAFPDANKADGLLVRSLRDGVLRLVLNNPPANVLSIALLERLMIALDTGGSDSDVRVIVIASTGNVFSAGHDLKEMTAHRADDDQGVGFFDKSFRACADLMLKIAHLPKPVIAEVDGLATAAGCQLVASCDLAICTDSSTFCTPGVNIGLFCSTPMVAVSRAAHRKQAMEMLLTGETIDASTAKDFGLVNRIVPKQYLAQVVSKYAAVIASKSPLTLKIGKEAFNRQLELPVQAAYDYATKVMVDSMLTQDAQEGIGAFLGKRTPEWKGE
ncbi:MULTISPECIES: enoyl-CoA hydratase [unclassified Rhizobium]|uniref:enoyl-CoA hydratase n=1 Tax=unclassified Rhizobium TaxID=2613769 RepID=UPI001C82BA17|nr:MULTISPECIES: enoyl-CoA hydratase [unclassified Rhizobium]MBX5163220.1 enoyl-CoA hydratase [Rhizobium sp. NZLR4b]MBX5183861.1 enoyl-CoA hydratase [Rhizobium sp. NZLR5]MBX5207639.1 enoyl-CoA hydratase [Rhizobium sp. NZLR11]